MCISGLVGCNFFRGPEVKGCKNMTQFESFVIQFWDSYLVYCTVHVFKHYVHMRTHMYAHAQS